MIYYLDTSAILKRYRTERGTDVVTELYERRQDDALITSYFSCLEVESAAARSLKSNRAAYDDLLAAFTHDLDDLIVLPMWQGLITDAIDVARRYALRSGDAIHVASAERAKAAIAAQIVFVAADREQLKATASAGMLTLDPEADDAIERLWAMRT